MKQSADESGRGGVPRPVKTTRIVTILDIVPGDPPVIVVSEQLCVRSRVRHFTQEVRVLDGQLFDRLLAEVGKGDVVEATIVTEFNEREYKTYLAGFSMRA
jgi:hypothetical protein